MVPFIDDFYFFPKEIWQKILTILKDAPQTWQLYNPTKDTLGEGSHHPGRGFRSSKSWLLGELTLPSHDLPY